jgi:hypothetical protein
MPPTITSIYYHQLCMVWQVEALYGHDPASAARAPEFFYLQGRYKDVESASEALRAALGLASFYHLIAIHL